MHPRKVLRQAFKARLIGATTDPTSGATTYATACADRWFATMTPPVNIQSILDEEGPVGMVYVRHEEEREEDYPTDRADGAFRRRLQVSIEVLATGAVVDDTLDDIAEQIEDLLQGWVIPGFPSVDSLLINSQIDVTDAEERILGGLFMSYHLKVWSPYRPATCEPWVPGEVWSVPNEENRAPPGGASPLGIPVSVSPEQALAAGWRPGEQIIFEGEP